MYTPEQVQKAREVKIHTLLKLPMYGRRVSMKCPFKDHDDSTASFSLYGDNSYRCYGCDRFGGNAVDFVMHLTGLDFKGAIGELLD